MDDKFYDKKLEGLRIIREHMVAIDRVYGDLVELEDAAPGGDSCDEYSHLCASLDELNELVDQHIEAVQALRTVPKITASEVHAVYVSSMK